MLIQHIKQVILIIVAFIYRIFVILLGICLYWLFFEPIFLTILVILLHTVILVYLFTFISIYMEDSISRGFWLWVFWLSLFWRLKWCAFRWHCLSKGCKWLILYGLIINRIESRKKACHASSSIHSWRLFWIILLLIATFDTICLSILIVIDNLLEIWLSVGIFFKQILLNRGTNFILHT